jgi:hypothetical protein
MKKQLQQALGSFSRFCIATFLFLVATPAFAEARTVPEEYAGGNGGFLLLMAIVIIGVVGGDAILNLLGNLIIVAIIGATAWATYLEVYWPIITIGVFLLFALAIQLVERVKTLVK